MGKKSSQPAIVSFCFVLAMLLPLLGVSGTVLGDDSMCTRVKIEIAQEASLERQGFEARLRVGNGFPDQDLENVDVDVYFQDEDGTAVSASFDPDDDQALFFIRVDWMDGIDDINGDGIVPPLESADVGWLIVPAPGASNGNPQGELYFVGAVVRYSILGEEHILGIAPDYIFVKPLPELALDYFLPEEVQGDDAFTSEIEPSIPFTFGAMVRNNGTGTALDFGIGSFQLEIVENDAGLVVGFAIEETYANGVPFPAALTADLGDIAPGSAGVARWIMTCSLSGQFTEFDVDWSHADELGGRLTSTISNADTHVLLHDVLVDYPGRDDIRDFLAEDDGTLRVFESDNLVSPVTDQSGSSAMTFSGADGDAVLYELAAPATAGFLYVALPDPYGGEKVLTGAIRSDGKRIGEENRWLSKSRDENNEWQYCANFFDADSPGLYTLIFEDPPALLHAPVLQFIPDYFRTAGELLSFVVESSDADGTIPFLAASPLPVGATFEDRGDGTGIFAWTPTAGQAGRYRMSFTASDGAFEAVRHATLTIMDNSDDDGDGMPESWEQLYFGDIGRDGKGDFDGDGVSDLDEYLNGSDPALFMGDFNDDNEVNLLDAVLATQILCGLVPDSTVDMKAAVSIDGPIGLIDASFVLRHIVAEN